MKRTATWVRNWFAGKRAARHGALGRWTLAAVAAVVAVACVAVAGLNLPADDGQAGLPVPADELAAVTAAAQSCPAMTAPRLAGQLMATSAFKAHASSTAVPGGTGIAGLSDAAWQKWAPGPQANRDNAADNILTLAHDMCDLTGQARTAQVPGDAWRAALAAFHSGMPVVTAATGVPPDARGYVDAVSRYATWYARQPGLGGSGPAASTTPGETPSGAASSGGPGSQSEIDGAVTGAGTDQFQYDTSWSLTTGVPDMYAGTANESHTAGATATFRFTGTQVVLHAVRDVDQGIMTVSLDGGSPFIIDNYSAIRNASGTVFVWTSPVLASATHTIIIVNTGQHNGASSGINIAIDRADVSR